MEAAWWLALVTDAAVCVFNRGYGVINNNLHRGAERGASSSTNKNRKLKVGSRRKKKLVNVHLRELLVCHFLLCASGFCFVWVAWLVFRYFLPIDWPVLCLLLLRRLNFGLRFGHDWVTGWIKLLNNENRGKDNSIIRVRCVRLV